MDKRTKITRLRRIAMTALVIVTAAGCAQTSDWLKGRKTAKASDSTILGAPEVDVYVKELGQLATSDPAAHAEIYADAASAAQLTPGPSTNLRLGMVLAIPGHAESDPQRAQSLLRDAVTQELLLTPAELSLAQILLNNVERQIVVNSEARQLRASTSQAAQTQELALGQRLARVEAENRQLRRDLEDAERKLEAITSIERSIREQE
ncbi:MAG: hypothetical protein K0U72_01860 [Gammaproteobacteria bacterium]|nr:hypothetical protein [Gammaproteobacteria bacterium]